MAKAKLGWLQEEFALAQTKLILHIYEQGYRVRLGDAFRDPRVHGEFGEKKAYGRAYSCHKVKLAIDLNLFKNGRYLSKTEHHKEFGKWWEETFTDETKGIKARWGGRFEDGNHYSFEWEGSR